MTKLLALLIASLALTLAACGGDDNNSSSSDSGGGTSSQESTGGGGSAGGGTTNVEIPEIAFQPKSVTVKSGTTVKWTNSDDLPHTVTKVGGPGPKFDSKTLNPGDTFEQTFTAKGKVDYVCTIHSGQSGSVTVK